VTDLTEYDELSIDELARRTGFTVRNIRAHQSRGLLPPPVVRGRTGFYGTEHLARIELIKELQADGFNLEAIRKLIDGAGGSTGDVLHFTRALRSSWEEEEPQFVSLEDLAKRWGDQADPALLDSAIRLGFMRPIGDDRYEERSPRLAQAAEELASMGIEPRVLIAVMERLHRHADGVAKAYVQLFLEEVWEPFVDDGQPDERWPEVQAAFERLRPLAADALLAMFQIAMTDRVDSAIGHELERGMGTAARVSGRPRSPGRSRSRRR
jgi:DNA-binding transcriptional MerR regulator